MFIPLIVPFAMLGTVGNSPEIGPEEANPAAGSAVRPGYTFDAIEHADPIEAGTRFLQKPYTASQLAHVIREVLDASTEAAGKR